MNERIKELMERCYVSIIDRRGDCEYDMEKFAELIVKECIAVIRADYVNQGTTRAVVNIEKHFGVE
jgi:hypothetical protein